MDDALLHVLKDSLDKKLRKESFEQALGKAVRRQNLDFKVYIDIMGELRERAIKEKREVEDIAQQLLAEGHKDS